MKRSAKIAIGALGFLASAALSACADMGWSLYSGPGIAPSVGVYLNGGNFMGPPPPPRPRPQPGPFGGPGPGGPGPDPAWSHGPWFFADPAR